MVHLSLGQLTFVPSAGVAKFLKNNFLKPRHSLTHNAIWLLNFQCCFQSYQSCNEEGLQQKIGVLNVGNFITLSLFSKSAIT